MCNVKTAGIYANFFIIIGDDRERVSGYVYYRDVDY